MNIWQQFVKNKGNKEITNLDKKSISYTIFRDLPDLNLSYFYENSTHLYAENPIVHRCIKLIADHGAHLALDGYQRGRLLKDSRFLRFLSSPNALQSQQGFFEQMIVSDRLHGNVYLKATVLEGEVTSITLLNPDYLTVTIDRDGMVTYKEKSSKQDRIYRYDVSTGEIRMVGAPAHSPVILIHIKTYNPQNMLSGLSPLKSCGVVGELFGRGLAWNLSLIKNSAKPSGILKTHDMLPAEQYNRLKDKFYEMFQGWDNTGKIPVLENGLEFQSIGLSPVDMDFLDMMKFAREVIASAFSIPLPLISADASTYNNISESKKALYYDAVLPVMNRIISELNKSLSKYFRGETIAINLDSIHGIGEDRAKIFDNLIKAVQAGIITTGEARTELGYESTQLSNRPKRA